MTKKRNGLGCGEHGQIHGAKGDGRNQIGNEHQLLHQLTGFEMAAAGVYITDQLTENSGDERSNDHQLERILQHLIELRIHQYAWLTIENFFHALANPIVQGQIAQAEIAQLEHQTLQNQNADGQHHCETQETRQQDSDGYLALF